MFGKTTIHIEIGDNMKDVLIKYITHFYVTYGSPAEIGSGISGIFKEILKNAKSASKLWRLGSDG